jgi:hypothetical protein
MKKAHGNLNRLERRDSRLKSYLTPHKESIKAANISRADSNQPRAPEGHVIDMNRLVGGMCRDRSVQVTPYTYGSAGAVRSNADLQNLPRPLYIGREGRTEMPNLEVGALQLFSFLRAA